LEEVLGSVAAAMAAMAGSFEVMGIGGDFSAAAAMAGDFEVSGLGRRGGTRASNTAMESPTRR